MATQESKDLGQLNPEEVSHVILKAHDKGMSWESEDMQVLAALLELRMPTLQFPAQSLRCAHHLGDSVDTLATRAMTCHLPGVSHQSTRPPGGGGWQLFGQCHSVRPRRELERRLLVESSQGPPLSPKRGLVHGRPGISQRDWGAERVQPIHPTFLLGQKISSPFHDLPAATLLERPIAIWVPSLKVREVIGSSEYTH